jgi:hypothetical protein
MKKIIFSIIILFLMISYSFACIKVIKKENLNDLGYAVITVCIDNKLYIAIPKAIIIRDTEDNIKSIIYSQLHVSGILEFGTIL